MLYSLLVAVLILSFFMSVFVPYMVIKAFERGFNISHEENIEIVKEPKLPKVHKAPKIDRKAETLLRNLDRYDGTGIGQEAIR